MSTSMNLSKNELLQKFEQTNTQKYDLKQISKSLEQKIQFMVFKIRKQFRSFTILNICGGERGNFKVQPNFQKSFLTLSLQQKVYYYCRFIQSIFSFFQIPTTKSNQTQAQPQEKPYTNILIPLKVRKGFASSQQTSIEINNFNAKSNGKSSFNINLKNYLIRKSKKKSLIYILQAIKNITPLTIRFQFSSPQQQQKYLPIINQCINDALYQNIKCQLQQFLKKQTKNSSLANSRPFKLKRPNELQVNNRNQFLHANDILQSRQSRQSRLNKSIVQDVVKPRDQQQLQLTQAIDQQNEQVQRLNGKSQQTLSFPYLKPARNLFNVILPTYQLKDLPSLHYCKLVYQSNNDNEFSIYQNAKNPSLFKMHFIIQLPVKIVCKAIYNVQLYKFWHQIIDEGQIKVKIPYENSCIMYLKTKAFSEWYRNRDYLVLAHLFKCHNTYYIVQKSIENTNYIPFQSITRGNIDHCVWKIESQTNQHDSKLYQCRVIMEMEVQHGGLLIKNHQKQLSLRYLKGFQNMQKYFGQQTKQKKLREILGFDWDIPANELESLQNQNMFKRSDSLNSFDFNNNKLQISQFNQQIFYSIDDFSEQQKQPQQQQEKEESQHQIDQPVQQRQDNMKQSQKTTRSTAFQQDIKLDEDGLVILPQKYLKKKHQIQPFDTPKQLISFNYQNIIVKDHWVLQKKGGLKLVNKQKIDAQNNVIKFIMSTLKKNIFSGKGVTGISLPVQIFNIDSNLQRCCSAMTLGPHFLEEVAKNQNQLQRFKCVIAFGLSNSLIYFDVEKPFNPILGQTYQGFIRGCPIYAEQISHHPPISTIYFIGRGYKVIVSLQAKVAIGLNSGDGINQGLYHVIFNDGQEVLFQTPPAELSGLAMGDRRFNFKGKGQYIDKRNSFFCQMKFESGGGLWGGKSKEFIDQIEGQILKIKSNFISKFLDAPFEKKPSPNTNDIDKKLGELSGRWPIQFKIDGEVYYNIQQDIPERMVDEIYPLNSNSNYREDLLYRKKNDLSRSQIEKERLQILQRGDKKLRQKFHGKEH